MQRQERASVLQSASPLVGFGDNNKKGLYNNITVISSSPTHALFISKYHCRYSSSQPST